jgi:phosphoserine phosphatase RsbU/P
MRRLSPTVPNSKLSELAREMSLRTLAPLAIAVFALFALLGPVIDILSGGRLPLSLVVRNTLLSGLVAIGYALGMMRRNWPLFAAAVAFQTVWILFFRGAGVPGPPKISQLTMDGIAVIVLMVLSYSSFLRFINVTASNYLRVRAEIDLAHGIHEVLVPAIEMRAGTFEFFGYSRPSGEVGGDLVDVVSAFAEASADTSSDTWFGYVADVSGHGVSSGLVMGMFKSALRMRLRQGGPLAAMLKDVNDVLFPLKSGSMFVTVACVRSGGAADTLDFAVAGHLPILRVRDGVVDEITTPQIPVAMFESYPFTSASIDSRPRDLLALITDGLIEVFDAKDDEFGLERMKGVLAENAVRPLPEIADGLVAAARAHGAQLDDQTLLLIRRT